MGYGGQPGFMPAPPNMYGQQQMQYGNGRGYPQQPQPQQGYGTPPQQGTDYLVPAYPNAGWTDNVAGYMQPQYGYADPSQQQQQPGQQPPQQFQQAPPMPPQAGRGY